MKFLSAIFGRKPQDEAPVAEMATSFDVDVPAEPVDIFAEDEVSQDDFAIMEAAVSAASDTDPLAEMPEMVEEDPSDISDLNLDAVETVLETVGKAKASTVNIWDLDDEQEEPAPVEEETDRASSRARRNRTRLIGFDKSDGDVVDLFDDSQPARQLERVTFPVGWMLVIEGPGRGECFALTSGMAQMGRGEDQAIQLDFGDNAISRNNHAAIVYDPSERKFLLGHGGKANIVRLNGKPVISNEDISDGDRITLGETTLMLKTLCGSDFDWEDTAEGEEQDDVAIA